jgi:DNA-binding response OmpR family regulator
VGSILLVVADPKARDLWTAAVIYAGHAVLEASAMRDALPLVREGGIDVVVIDADDPVDRVVDVAKSIEALPDGPPIVLVSGSPGAPEISVRIRAAAFIAKPCEASEIVAAIERLFGHTRPVQVFEDEPTGPTRQLG